MLKKVWKHLGLCCDHSSLLQSVRPYAHGDLPIHYLVSTLTMHIPLGVSNTYLAFHGILRAGEQH